MSHFAGLLLALGGITFSTLLVHFPATESSAKITVCEALMDLKRFRGQTVEIRGEFNGVLLGNCPDVKTNNWLWPKAIYVAAPWDPARSREVPADWEVSFGPTFYIEAVRGIWKRWEALPPSQRKVQTVLATIVGRLDAREGGLAIDGSGLPNGYGEQGTYPAQLVIMEFKDLAIGPAENGAHPPLDKF